MEYNICRLSLALLWHALLLRRALDGQGCLALLLLFALILLHFGLLVLRDKLQRLIPANVKRVQRRPSLHLSNRPLPFRCEHKIMDQKRSVRKTANGTKTVQEFRSSVYLVMTETKLILFLYVMP